MAEINIDATHAIAGRVASFVAKQALLGHTVNVFNCEKAVVSGSSKALKERYQYLKFKTGRPRTGPFISKMPDRFVRRMIRGMVQHKEPRGGAAYERIMCYIGVPAAHADKKLVKVAKEYTELPKLKYTTIHELCSALGGEL